MGQNAQHELDDFRRNWLREAASTEAVIAAIPADRLSWRPHPRSMSAGGLAGHIIGSEIAMSGWAASGDASAKLSRAAPAASDAAGLAALIAWGRAERALALDALAKRIGELDRTMSCFGVDMRRFDVLWLTVKHCIHHRGQLTVYLRLLGAKVPGVYGPSADEESASPE